MVTPNVIILDWGDTLCDSTGTYNKISSKIPAVFVKHGINISPEEYPTVSSKVRNDLRRELKGDVTRHTPGLHEKRIAKELGKTITDTEAKDIDAEIFALFLGNIRARSGAETFLQDTKKAGKNIIVISNSNKTRLYDEINALGFMKYFDLVICSQECGYEKSDLVPYILALEAATKNKWIRSISEVLVIGDREEEDGSARRLGIEVRIIDKNASDAFTGLSTRP